MDQHDRRAAARLPVGDPVAMDRRLFEFEAHLAPPFVRRRPQGSLARWSTDGCRTCLSLTRPIAKYT